MGSTKKLGKGFEDISYLFLSSSEKGSLAKDLSADEADYPQKKTTPILETAAKSMCLIGDGPSFKNAFLVINLSLALARLGMRILVVDMDEELPCLNFFLGKDIQSLEFDSPQDLIKEGPLGVKLMGLNKFALEKFSSNEDRQNLISQLNNAEGEVDLILISLTQENFSQMRYLLRGSMKEFLVLVTPDKHKMLNSYKIIKTIFFDNPLAKIGAVITDINHMYEIETVFNKIAHAAREFLDKELCKYGFLFKIKQEVNSTAKITSFYDADLTACISNIAQIVVLRLNLGEKVQGEGSLFEKIVADFSKARRL